MRGPKISDGDADAIVRAEVARAFCIHLREQIEVNLRWPQFVERHRAAGDVVGTVDEVMAEIVRRNKVYGDRCCASHDYCDANMPMAEAFEDVLGYEPDGGDEGDCALWNDAWDLSKRVGFNPARLR